MNIIAWKWYFQLCIQTQPQRFKRTKCWRHVEKLKINMTEMNYALCQLKVSGLNLHEQYRLQMSQYILTKSKQFNTLYIVHTSTIQQVKIVESIKALLQSFNINSGFLDCYNLVLIEGYQNAFKQTALKQTSFHKIRIHTYKISATLIT